MKEQPMLEVLLVDDEPSIRLSVGRALRAAGHTVTLASDGAEALGLVESRVFDVVVSDVRLPGLDGMSLFRRIRALSPQTDVILITAYGTVEDVVAALKEGARDYLTKPFDTDEVVIRVNAIAERRTLQRQLSEANEALATRAPGTTIIGSSPVMARLLQRIETLAPADSPVLITGESGTGKELVARRLHALSPRRGKPFVAVNCAAFPETLIEAELFGHERGAFTGAVRRREGRFGAANGGSLLLDEVAEIPLPAQAKLLRVLQEGMIEPLGTNAGVPVDVRVISATHRDLKQWIADGRFREDLYYRLNVLDIAIPPLRERRGDLPTLVEHFIRSRIADGATSPGIAPAAWAALTQYAFPGNVRELEHAIEHAVVLAQGTEIEVEHLPADIRADVASAAASAAAAAGPPGELRPLSAALKEFERTHLQRALTLAGGRKTRAAEILGISRKNLWEKLRAHSIDGTDKSGE
jgi:DNA-binding NtrC family response regulator